MKIEGTSLETALAPEHRDVAIKLLRGYFRTFEGANFERFAGGGDRLEVRDRFTSDDLVAITMLGVSLKPAAALEILEVRRESFYETLKKVPSDVSFEAMEAGALGEEWPVRQLLSDLTAIPDIGTTRATKLMARKRPSLVPILDSVVNQLLRVENERYWKPLHAWLTEDDSANAKHLRKLRDEAGIGSDISVIRVFDILAWRAGRGDVERMLG